MRSRRFLAWCVGTCFAVALSPLFAHAQTMGVATTTGAATTGTTTGTTGTTGAPISQSNNGTSSNSTGTYQSQNNAQNLEIQSSTIPVGFVPSSANVVGTTYGNPLSGGMASNYTQFGKNNLKPTLTFGQPLYTNKTATTTGARTTGGIAGGGNTSQGTGFNTFGTPRAPVYATVLDPDLMLPAPPTARVQSDLRAALARSSYLSNQQNIEIIINGSTVELRGQVASQKEFRAAEGIVALSPGVTDVINRLQVNETPSR